MRHVFVSYVREDCEPVDRLAAELRQRGFQVWLDRDHIPPGQRWRDAIREAIRQGDLFIACFSRHSIGRERTYMNEELVLAVEELRTRPTDRSWFIPVSLDGSRIPGRSIGAGETLHDLQAVDLSQRWSDGIQRIAAVAEPTPSVTPRPRRSETATERALRLDREQIEATRLKELLWSPAGVNAALREVKNLHVTLAARASELSLLTSSLSIESETSFPSSVVRLANHSVVAYWHQLYGNEVEDARLYVLEYDFPYYFSLPNRTTDPTTKKEFQFAICAGEHGWSSGGEFITSNDVVDICFELLLARAEQQK